LDSIDTDFALFHVWLEHCRLKVCVSPIVFDGPVFDFWREVGLLNSESPVYHLEPVTDWMERLTALVEAPRPVTIADRILEVSRFLDLLTAMTVTASDAAGETPQMQRLLKACRILEAGLNQPVDLAALAREVGMSYDSFRKQFQKHIGVSPTRYRTIRRIDAACAMLQHSDITISAVAQSLNFSDEFHFSKRFKQISGMTPREFRRRLPSGASVTPADKVARK